MVKRRRAEAALASPQQGANQRLEWSSAARRRLTYSGGKSVWALKRIMQNSVCECVQGDAVSMAPFFSPLGWNNRDWTPVVFLFHPDCVKLRLFQKNHVPTTSCTTLFVRLRDTFSPLSWFPTFSASHVWQCSSDNYYFSTGRCSVSTDSSTRVGGLFLGQTI